MPAEFLGNLPKNLTTHLTHKLYAVFPYPDNARNIAHIPTNGKVPTLSSEDFSCIIGVKMKK